MLILPMVGVLHRTLTVILLRAKKLGIIRTRRQRILQIVIGSKMKTTGPGQKKRRALVKAPKPGNTAQVSPKNLANVPPNPQARTVARRMRRRKARNQ